MSPPSAKINGAYVQGLIIATVAGGFAWNFVRLLEKIMGEGVTAGGDTVSGL
jgi:hypothetical protein